MKPSLLILGAVLQLCVAVRAHAESIHISFGSCGHQDKPQPIWKAILGERPDMFIFLGDNIYGDSTDMKVLERKYAKLNTIPGFKKIREQTRVVATWDDHDYGENDAGAEFSAKVASRELMLDFWNEPTESIRRTQDGGIYTSYTLGKEHKVQIILLDTRWNRTSLLEVKGMVSYGQRVIEDRGPYLANPDVDASLLGETQWRWLEAELEKEVDVRIIGTSIQLLPEFSGWESWANFPVERQRMIDMLNKYQREPVVLISGDVHWAELSKIDQARKWPLVELTSSGLTEEWTAVSPNVHRVGEAYPVANYGNVEIELNEQTTLISLSIKDVKGDVLIEQNLEFDNLEGNKPKSGASQDI